MSPEDVLPSLVEISIAVAGFSGVVAALSPVPPKEWRPRTRLAFSILLSSTLISLSLTLFAMVLRSTSLAAPTTWALVSATHIVALLMIASLRIYQSRRSMAWQPFAALFLLNIVIIAIQLANTVHFRLGWLSVAGLTLYALFGFVNFIMLVSSIWGSTSLDE